jgi:hypothetical protein
VSATQGSGGDVQQVRRLRMRNLLLQAQMVDLIFGVIEKDSSQKESGRETLCSRDDVERWRKKRGGW